MTILTTYMHCLSVIIEYPKFNFSHRLSPFPVFVYYFFHLDDVRLLIVLFLLLLFITFLEPVWDDFIRLWLIITLVIPFLLFFKLRFILPGIVSRLYSCFTPIS